MKTPNGKQKKQQRKMNKLNLPKFYVKLKNTRTGYTKLVSADKAFEMINGKFDELGQRKLQLKDRYIEVK